MLLTTDARRVYFQSIGAPGTTDDYRTQAIQDHRDGGCPDTHTSTLLSCMFIQPLCYCSFSADSCHYFQMIQSCVWYSTSCDTFSPFRLFLTLLEFLFSVNPLAECGVYAWLCGFQSRTGGSQVIHFSNGHALIPANLEQLIHPSSCPPANLEQLIYISNVTLYLCRSPRRQTLETTFSGNSFK